MVEDFFAIFPWQVVIFLSGLVSGFSHFVRKSQLHRLGVFQVGFWKDVGSVGIALLVWLSATSFEFDPLGWWVFAVGLLAGVGNGAYMSALRGDMSGTSTFGTTAGQLFILLGSFVFFGEWRYFEPTSVTGMANLLAVGLFFVGMWLYGGGKVGRWWKMMMLSISTNVVLNLVSKYVIDSGGPPAENTLMMYLGTLVGGTAMLVWRRQGVWIGYRDVALGVFQGVLGGFAVYLYMVALVFAPLSLASMTRRVAIIGFSVVAGMWWFGERKGVTWQKIVGLVMALVVFGLVAAVNG